jgi:hypothetical protein
LIVRPVLHELLVADDPAVWRSVGFDIDEGVCQIGSTTIRFVDDDIASGGGASGIVGWSFVGVDAQHIDGIRCAPTDGAIGLACTHPNTSVLIDHVVVMTPNLARTNEALSSVGLDLRRVRDVPGTEPLRQQAFYRSGEVVIEVVGTAEPTGTHPASLWGLVTVVSDIDAAAAHLGDRLATPKDAVQPGRRIATVRREAGLSVPLAFITPHPRTPSPI